MISITTFILTLIGALAGLLILIYGSLVGFGYSNNKPLGLMWSVIGIGLMIVSATWMINEANTNNEIYAKLCVAAGGNHVEYPYRATPECWDSRTGLRVFPDVRQLESAIN